MTLVLPTVTLVLPNAATHSSYSDAGTPLHDVILLMTLVLPYSDVVFPYSDAGIPYSDAGIPYSDWVFPTVTQYSSWLVFLQ